MDKLEFLFMLQKDLQKHITDADLPAERPDLVSYHALGLISELGEVLQVDKRWKPWNQDKAIEVDKEALSKEIADCWLFLINLTLVLGLDVEALFTAFMAKHNEVRDRNSLPHARFYPSEDGEFRGYSHC